MPKEKEETRVRKGKRKKKNKKSSERWKKYIQGKKPRFCPRCGPGIFLAEHKDRLFCGKCYYTEYTTKK
ncbi:MAG: 30S ribosomal protein S27ae [Candidatus Pacearchaeota archaeon]|nr:30S ribosomal protein S27ae [Candidatus Pacearchaeota archaeon]